jgi:hypothetical protein
MQRVFESKNIDIKLSLGERFANLKSTIMCYSMFLFAYLPACRAPTLKLRRKRPAKPWRRTAGRQGVVQKNQTETLPGIYFLRASRVFS